MRGCVCPGIANQLHFPFPPRSGLGGELGEKRKDDGIRVRGERGFGATWHGTR